MLIKSKTVLSDLGGEKTVRFDVYAPQIAKKALPGQFVVIMAKENGERIPLTIVDKNESLGIITIIIKGIGFSSKLICSYNQGDSFYAVAGPMGTPTDTDVFGNVMLIGGGVGIAEIYPVAKALKEKGNILTVILAARTKGALILESELSGLSKNIHVFTEDGSKGTKGLATDILDKQLRDQHQDLLFAVGPVPMMKSICSITKKHSVRTVVSLNTLMVDATGMCGCCRVTVGKNVKLACVDGPDFDGWLIDWDELEHRQGMYKEKEQHICSLYDYD